MASVSIKDVAARAVVSPGTVSNVLNRPAAVRSATRARVDAALAELGFVPHASARQLDAGRSRTIAYPVQPRQLLGRTAARLLAEESDSSGAHRHEHVVFPPELVARASTAATRRVAS